ncbi:ABC transporter ATP-binding protein [Corynebacterium mendelii]|uniref:ABC transporter ATP-binding protein n=1 Tax=Corynebacterium mendelii TaxID=2765362 RepID=A0A939DZH7_9CORY|nr:ABC transporter ATP-binding protein [Corynebacterium mendelii]MBN9643695.1 ABC transporter ATP-binding protein [Corynebacterium mendelii]
MTVRSHPLVGVTRPVHGRLLVAAVYQVIGGIGVLGVGAAAVLVVVTALGWGGDADRLAGVLAAAGLLAVAGWFGRWRGDLVAHRADNELQRLLRSRIVDGVSQAPLEWVDATGKIAVKRTVTDDVDALHSVVGHAFGTTVSAAVQIAAGIGVLLVVAPVPTLVAALPAAAAWGISRRLRRTMPANRKKFARASAALDAAAVEFAQALAALKIFGGTQRGLDRFHAASRDYSRFVAGWATSMTPYLVGQQLLLSAVAVWAMVALSAAGGWATPGQLVAVAIIMPLLFSPVEAVAFSIHDLAMGTDAATRITTVMDAIDSRRTAPARAEAPGGPATGPLGVRVDNVTLVRGGKKVLDAVSLVIEPGTRTVILGESGAGKSTLLEVIAGLVAPTSGSVTTGNPARVAALWQQPFIVEGTVADNLRMGTADATDRDIADAVRRAGIAGRIAALDGGLGAVIGDGTVLSGGQRQRLCLARALVSRPGLLLLDEPTSAVDAAAADRIDRALDELAGHCTLVRVDHRARTGLDADRVIVVDSGRIVDDGPPGQLLAAGGVFADLVADQTIPVSGGGDE